MPLLQFTSFNLSTGYVEFRELCRYAQIYRGDIVFIDKYLSLCKERGVSASFAATEAGISKSLITKWKNNKTVVPSPEVLQKLSSYFGISVAELLDEEIANAHAEMKYSERERLMQDMASQMSDDLKDKVLEYMEFLLKKN